MYKGVDEDSGKKQDGCEADQLNKKAEKGKGGSALLRSRGINLLLPAHSCPWNADGGASAFSPKGKPSPTAADGYGSAGFRKVEA